MQDARQGDDIVWSAWQHAAVGDKMHYLYKITAPDSERYYYGITVHVTRRIATHKHASKTKNTPLYSWMRKHTDWSLKVVAEFESKELCCEAEVAAIANSDSNCLNLSPGGEGGFVILDRAAWIEKLKAARKGRKPALGMNHTEETKARLRQVMAEREREYPEEVLNLSFADAHDKFGISKTHFYRLRKRAKINDLG